MNPNDLKQVLEALSQADVREFALKTSDYELSIKRGPEAPVLVSGLTAPPPSLDAPVPLSAPASAPAATSTPSSAPAAPATPAAAPSNGKAVKAPIVGTFYAAPSPDKPPFVQLGDTVTVGQTLCILEAMKLMNEIESEFAGTVLEVKIKNGEPVEYGQTLFVIG